MPDLVANTAKGRLIELYRNVDANTPTGCALIVAAFSGTVTDAALEDLNSLADVTGSTLDEATQAGYARKVLVAADLAAQTTDDTNNRNAFTLPAQSWVLTSAATAWTRVGLFYRPSATPAGGDADFEFCGAWDFVTTGGIATETITFPDPVFTAT